jgi:hypothetical protein
VTREKDAKAEQLTAALPTDKTIFEPGGLIPRSKQRNGHEKQKQIRINSEKEKG